MVGWNSYIHLPIFTTKSVPKKIIISPFQKLSQLLHLYIIVTSIFAL